VAQADADRKLQEKGAGMNKHPFDYSGSSIWTRDTKLKRYKQGDDCAKKRQDKRDINDKEQVFIYSKALSKK
jgi:hypothetical protein